MQSTFLEKKNGYPILKVGNFFRFLLILLSIFGLILTLLSKEAFSSEHFSVSKKTNTIFERHKKIIETIIPKVVIFDLKSSEPFKNGLNKKHNEFVVIANFGEDIDISGWYIADKKGHKFLFESLLLKKASLIRLHTGIGVNTISDLFWNLKHPIWKDKNKKPNVILFNSVGAIVDKW